MNVSQLSEIQENQGIASSNQLSYQSMWVKFNKDKSFQ